MSNRSRGSNKSGTAADVNQFVDASKYKGKSCSCVLGCGNNVIREIGYISPSEIKLN
jgi:hypothetical protein